MWPLVVHPNHYKKYFTFFSSCTRMSGKNVNFRDKKMKKSNFYKNKKVIKIDDIDVDKILVSEEKPYVQKILSNTLLDTMMIMMLSDHYT